MYIKIDVATRTSPFGFWTHFVFYLYTFYKNCNSPSIIWKILIIIAHNVLKKVLTQTVLCVEVTFVKLGAARWNQS